MGLGKTLSGFTTVVVISAGCSVCQTNIINERLISSDGVKTYAKYVHCSSLNNTVEFYLDRPGKGSVLIGRGDDLEEFSEKYEEQSHTIILMTPDPSDVNVLLETVGPYHIRKSGSLIPKPHRIR